MNKFFKIKVKKRRIDNFLYKKFIETKGKLAQNFISSPYEVVQVPVIKIKKQNIELYKERWKPFIFANHRVCGRVKKGDWDKDGNCVSFEKQKHYLALKQRFLECRDWEDTDYFLFFKNRESEVELRGNMTWLAFKENCLKDWDFLFNNINKYGYKNENEKKGKPEKEIEVAVDRNGEIQFVDGKHRLSIAKILGIKEVPVIVNVWHKEFIDKLKTEVRGKITSDVAMGYILEKDRQNQNVKDCS